MEMITLILVAVFSAVVQGDGNLMGSELRDTVNGADAGLNKTMSRIAGGTKCQNCPWMASLQKQNSSGWVHFCDGTIIRRKWVLTAAHCFPKGMPWHLRARVGSSEWNSGGQTRKIEVVVRPLGYRLDTPAINDIALVGLDTEVSFNEWTKSLSLPRSDSVFPLGAVLTASGWGRTEESSAIPSDHYRYVQLKTVDCLEHFPNILKGAICAHDSGKSCWYGNEGGPLYDENTLQVVAIVTKCGSPGYHTGVAHYVDWIKSRIGETGESSSGSTYQPLLVCWLVSLLHFLLFSCVRLN